LRRSARATRRDSCEKARPSRLSDDSNQWMRADTGLTGRNIDHRRRLRSCTLRWAIARFDLISFATQIFPARLVNSLHLQVAEEAAFLHRNPTGHLNFAARSTERRRLHIAPTPAALFFRLAVNLRELGILPVRCRASPPREVHFSACRRWLSAPVDRFSCAGQSFFLRGVGYPAHGIFRRPTEQRKNKGWQDRLPPVLGAIDAFVSARNCPSTAASRLHSQSSRIQDWRRARRE
jgi:hypothetical protein